RHRLSTASPDQLKGPPAGRPNEVLVLGSPHCPALPAFSSWPCAAAGALANDTAYRRRHRTS
ncbi:hypothetical protein C7E25_23730, partial [Stenotrophomonas maltophilia]